MTTTLDTGPGNKVKIVSFDPSLSNLGIAYFEFCLSTGELNLQRVELIHTEATEQKQVRKNSDDMERARILVSGMMEACEGRAIAIAEVPVGSQSSRAMAGYGVCIGVLAACPIPLIQVTPTEVKLAGYGVKTATKQEMIDWASQKYPDANWLTKTRRGQKTLTAANEHLADAVAAAHAGVKTQQFKQAAALLKSMRSTK